jgi:ubiquinone biosynthesis protein COQ9
LHSTNIYHNSFSEQPSKSSSSPFPSSNSSTSEGAHRFDIDQTDEVRRALLTRAVSHIPSYGFTDACLEAAATEMGFSPALKSLVDGPADLAHHISTEFDSQLMHAFIPSSARTEYELWSDAIFMRISMLHPLQQHWPSAIALMAHPMVAARTLKRGLAMSDDIASVCGDQSVDAEWYRKRAVIGAVYAASELFFLRDRSHGLVDTRGFVERRVQEAVRLSELPSQAAKTLGDVFTLGLALLRTR